MQERYRKDYDGEMVVTSIKQVGGQKEYNREWIDNPLKLESISGRATCVTNGPSTEGYHLKRLQNHHGGLLGTLSMHVYATDELYQSFNPNFLVTFNDEYLNDLQEKQLTEEIFVYTSTQKCLQYPGEFFIVPYSYKSTPEVVAAWLACFDGHDEVYLLGYDEYTKEGKLRSKLVANIKLLMETYSNVKFNWVVKSGEIPKEWRHLRNLRKLSVNEYTSYCDVS